MNLDFTKISGVWMGLVWWNQQSVWCQQLKSRDMDKASGIKGSFLELTFTCTLMSKKGVLLSIALRVYGIPSKNW